MKFSFGVLVNDIVRLDMVLRRSQLDPGIPCHTIKAPDSAAKGLNKLLGIIEAEWSDVAILAHQDMYFSDGWLDTVKERLAVLPESWVVAGIVGKDMGGAIVGKMWDTRIPTPINQGEGYPIPASCFDECVIIVNAKKRFRFDEHLPGFDLYGTMCVCQAWEMGGTAWIIDAFAQHHCMRPFDWFPDKKFEKAFKWLHERFPNAPRIDTTVLGVPREPGPPRYDKTVEKLAELTQAAREEVAARIASG